jgi:hypothetical protein
MIVTITYDHAARRRSYQLVAQALGMEQATGRQEPAEPVRT